MEHSREPHATNASQHEDSNHNLLLHQHESPMSTDEGEVVRRVLRVWAYHGVAVVNNTGQHVQEDADEQLHISWKGTGKP